MKTEVKFRELPEKVQGFLRREAQESYNIRNEEIYRINLESLHNLPEWSEATDEERLAYAEWRYRDGVIFRSTMSGTECKSDGIITDDDYEEKSYIFAGDNDVYNYRTNKWAEIISDPEEKPVFKVGDRPEWTPELIKQLPHGTELKCAYFPKDVFVYHGQEIQYDFYNDLKIKNYFHVGSSAYFTYIDQSKYAEILSLPDIKETSPEAQQEFVKANPGMQHVEEPKAGDMVEARIDGWPETEWRNRKYLCKNSFGKFVCEYKDGSVEIFDEIRLPQKSEVESKAKELWEKPGNEDLYVWEIVMQGIKWGQANPDKI